MTPEKIAAYFCFDPRDPEQSVEDRATWKRSSNAILISATMLLAADAERCPISWDKVAALADLCDQHDNPRARTPRKRATRAETDAMLRTTLRKACC